MCQNAYNRDAGKAIVVIRHFFHSDPIYKIYNIHTGCIYIVSTLCECDKHLV